jgi:hypothetical protein
MMNHLRLLITSVSASFILTAQTPVESDAIRYSLDTIQQKTSALRTMMDSSIKPANWRDLVIADTNAIITAATSAGTTARNSTTSLTGAQSITVPSGGSIQAALNAANPGDTIILQAGGIYKGGLILPVKSGTSYITITSSAVANLPEGKRVGPDKAPAMARIVGQSEAPVITTTPGAHHFRFIGVEILAMPGLYASTAVQLGSGMETSDSQLPSDIELDRVWIHAEAPGWAKRGITLNGKRLTLKNSWVAGFRSTWQETQAVGIWNTPGPLQVSNNYLEAAGMAILIGGAEPSVVGVTPSDIQITGNLMSRPVAWRTQSLIVKNLLEMKTGRRVSVTGNILENTWAAAQTGYAVNIKPGTENVRTPAITSDVLFTNNIVRHTTGGILISGTNSVGGKVSNITIRNNLFDDLGPNWGYRHSLFTAIAGVTGLIIENNTATPSVLLNTLVLADGAPSTGFVFRANVVPHGTYGVFSSGHGQGTKALTASFPGSLFTNNVIFDSPNGIASLYPSANYFPLTSTAVGWVSGIYELAITSTFKSLGLGGKDPGVDMDALIAATLRAATGR